MKELPQADTSLAAVAQGTILVIAIIWPYGDLKYEQLVLAFRKVNSRPLCQIQL